MKTYMQKLRALREDNDLSQTDVADYLGTSQTMYARYEREANELPLRHFVALCRYYNVSADDLLGTAPTPHRKNGIVGKRDP
ncbi:MAG: helix-turn-helix domain-containing protein [Oscillospiraceae bacterium]|nr:helix-turn-helix domain-containing protein [Oscillospiraceae bacterium]